MKNDYYEIEYTYFLKVKRKQHPNHITEQFSMFLFFVLNLLFNRILHRYFLYSKRDINSELQ